jgi:hypothetical protein
VILSELLNFKIVKVPVVLYESETCFVWEWNLFCMRVKLVLYESETCFVWEWNMFCMRVKLVLYESETCFVREWNLFCMRVKLVLYESETCFVWEWNLFLHPKYWAEAQALTLLEVSDWNLGQVTHYSCWNVSHFLHSFQTFRDRPRIWPQPLPPSFQSVHSRHIVRHCWVINSVVQ